MRIFAIFLFFPLLSIAQQQSSSETVNNQGVHFLDNHSWATVKEFAKADNKYILVDCYASWCGPCKTMDQRTYPDHRVGDIVNQHFISIKVQCDTSKSDQDDVKARYTDAHEIVSEFHVHEYPTILFFSPDGRLVHKGIGYHSPNDFIRLAKAAMDSTRQYFTLLRDFRDGKLDYDRMDYLAELADQYDERKLYVSVARTYVTGFLDQMPDSGFYKRQTWDILNKYIGVLRTDDRIIVWLMHHLSVGDSILQHRGASSKIADQVVYNERMMPMINQAKKSGVKPDWRAINDGIVKDFGNNYSNVIIQGRIDWYQFKEDWENFSDALIDRVEYWRALMNPQEPDDQELFNMYAFGIFQRSQDPNKLKKALGWSDLVVGAIGDSSRLAAEYIDTKANLLYKLGRKNEAILLESRAVSIKPRDKDISTNLQKMTEGKPTW